MSVGMALDRAGLRLNVGDPVSFEIHPSRHGPRHEAQYIQFAG
jgi:hypothetical protein